MILVLFFQNLYSIWRKLLDKYRAAICSYSYMFFFSKELEINISKLHIGITFPLYCILSILHYFLRKACKKCMKSQPAWPASILTSVSHAGMNDKWTFDGQDPIFPG